MPKVITAKRTPSEAFRVWDQKSAIVRSLIAASEAGDIANLHVVTPRVGKAPLEIGAQFASAVEMAAHIGADANLGLGGRHEMKMGIETRDAVDLVERRLGAF